MGHQFSTIFNYFVWLRITDEGSVPEMRIWSILLIQSDLKWRIHLSKSLFFVFKCAPFRLHDNSGKWDGWALKSFVNSTGGMTAVTPADRPKSVLNRCVIERICSVFV